MTHMKSSMMRVAIKTDRTHEMFDGFFTCNSRIKVAIQTGDTHERQYDEGSS